MSGSLSSFVVYSALRSTQDIKVRKFQYSKTFLKGSTAQVGNKLNVNAQYVILQDKIFEY